MVALLNQPYPHREQPHNNNHHHSINKNNSHLHPVPSSSTEAYLAAIHRVPQQPPLTPEVFVTEYTPVLKQTIKLDLGWHLDWPTNLV